MISYHLTLLRIPSGNNKNRLGGVRHDLPGARVLDLLLTVEEHRH